MLGDVWKSLLDLALPRVCVVCSAKLLRMERHICWRCLSDLPVTHFQERDHNPMADRWNESIKRFTIDGDREPYSFAAALFYYSSESGFRNIAWALKYKRDIGQGRYFARILGEKLASSGLFADVDCIIPVPLHWTRLLKRGYNQSNVIAEGISPYLPSAGMLNALKRTRRTRTQTRIGIQGKAANVADAFAVKPECAGRLLTCRHILLVDDTFTTGATLASCFSALRKVLPSSIRISCATLDFVSDDL